MTANSPSETNAIASAISGTNLPSWSNDQYHADRTAVSCSVLKEILRSPAHMKAYREAPNIETNSRLIGNALHASVLEPEMFEQTYIEWREGNRTGKAYTQFVADNEGKSILKPEEMTKILRMRDSILSFSEYPIGQLLKEGQNEQSIIWTDEATGVRCKIRPDNENQFCLLDLKTTDDARPYAFVRNSVRMMYDMQAAMYQEGVYATTGEKKDFYFIAVEDEAPYSTWVHQASSGMIASGMEKFRKALNAYKTCLETGEYPGYPMPSSIIEWPSYA